MAKPKGKSTGNNILDVNEILHTTSSEDSLIKGYVARHANRIGKADDKNPSQWKSSLIRNRS